MFHISQEVEKKLKNGWPWLDKSSSVIENKMASVTLLETVMGKAKHPANHSHSNMPHPIATWWQDGHLG
jgi:hypothetical protein